MKYDHLKTTKEVLEDHLGIDEEHISADSRLEEDLGCDSLDIVEIIMEFEEIYNMDIREEDVVGLKTVGELVNYLEKRLPNE